MHTGQLASVVVDSLSAFFPGVQTLVGDLESAIKAHAVYAFQWKRYAGLPELFDINRRVAVSLGELRSPCISASPETDPLFPQATLCDPSLSSPTCTSTRCALAAASCRHLLYTDYR